MGEISILVNIVMFKISAWMRWFGLAVTALTLTIACSQQPNATTPNATTPNDSSASQTPPLISATSNWIGSSSYFVADKKDLFKEADVKVQELFFQSSSDIVTALMTEKADLAWMTTAEAVQMVEKEPSLKIIYLLDYSNGADAIIGRNIKSPKDLKGKTVARENVLYEKILLQAYLNKAGLKESDVKIKDMVAAEAATAFATKQVDAAVTFEPYLTKAAKQGAGETIFSSKNTNLVADAIVVRQNLIQSRKAEVQNYLKAVDKATKLINGGNPDALKIAADKMGVSVAEIKSQLQGVKLFDLEGNKTIAFNKGHANSVIGNLEITAKAATEFKLVMKPIDPTSLYDASIVESL
jgi:NitT/TauT family transport system substrate-binding protein